jgi:uncharacterized repeat protein (TIGR01451 family)
MFVPLQHQTPLVFKSLVVIARRLISLLIATTFLVASVTGWPQSAQAQVPPAPFQPVTALNVTPPQDSTLLGPTLTQYATPCDTGGTLPGCAGANVSLTFGQGGNRFLQSFVAAGLTLTRVININERVEFRRNGPIARDILFFEHAPIVGANPPTAISLLPDFAAQIPQALISPIVNRGVDNVFNNNEAGTQETRNNLQRIDYLLPDGVVVPPDNVDREGFLVLERVGATPDVFGIAAITGLDAAGNPSSYGPLVRAGQNAADWGTANQVQLNTAVFRRDDLADPIFRPSHLVGQQRVGGIFFPVSSLLAAPQSSQPIFGYSLVAGDVTAGGNALVDFTNTAVFPLTTGQGSNAGGLDLVAGGLGFYRLPVLGELALNKRITQLTVSGTTTVFPNVEGTGTGLPELVAADLGQGRVNVTDQQLLVNDEIEYTLYLNKTGTTTVNNVAVCDQIPAGGIFAPDSFGPGLGIQAIAPTAPQAPPSNYTTVNYTNVAGDDPGTYFPPGVPLPEACGPDRGNGAVVVDVGSVGAGQVGRVRFRVRIN